MIWEILAILLITFLGLGMILWLLSKPIAPIGQSDQTGLVLLPLKEDAKQNREQLRLAIATGETEQADLFRVVLVAMNPPQETLRLANHWTQDRPWITLIQQDELTALCQSWLSGSLLRSNQEAPQKQL